MMNTEMGLLDDVSGFEKLKRSLGMPSLKRSLLLSAVGVAASAASQADAGIIIKTDSLTVTDESTVGWDVNGDSSADITLFDNTPFMCGGPNTTGSLDFFVLTSSGSGGFLHTGSQLLPVINSTIVGNGGTFSNLNCATHDNPCGALASSVQDFSLFPGAGPNFSGRLGFFFDNNGTTNYGIADFTFAGLDGIKPHGTFTITSWLYDDSGAAVNGTNTAAVVPEPTSIAAWGTIMAIGLGARHLRRKKSG